MAKNCDPTCYDLAETWLSNDPPAEGFTKQDVMSLALEIQQAIEDWFENRYPTPPEAA